MAEAETFAEKVIVLGELREVLSVLNLCGNGPQVRRDRAAHSRQIAELERALELRNL